MIPDTTALFGASGEFEFEGKSYKIKPLVMRHYAEFAGWLVKRAHQQLRVASTELSPDEMAHERRSLRQDVDAGLYDFGGEVFVRATQTLSGIKRLIMLALKDESPEVDEAFVDRLVEAKLAELTALMAELNSDPKAARGRQRRAR